MLDQQPLFNGELPKTFDIKTIGGTTAKVPSVGFGTWASGNPDWCYQATLKALQAGYRHIDGAWKYGVDEQIGRAIRDSGVPRSEIFVTTKFWPHFMHPANVEKCLNTVLKDTGLEYVDLYLAHWPVAFKADGDLTDARAAGGVPSGDDGSGKSGIAMGQEIVKNKSGVQIDLEHSCGNIAEQFGAKGSFVPTWLAMVELVKAGKARAVGVSNFSIAQLQEVLPYATDVPISVNQVEAHPWLPNDELFEFMRHHDIQGEAYCPLGGQSKAGTLTEDPIVKTVATKNHMDVGQVLQSWAIMRGTIPLGKSQSENRIKSNLQVKGLPKEDFEAISSLKKKDEDARICNFNEAWGIQLFV